MLRQTDCQHIINVSKISVLFLATWQIIILKSAMNFPFGASWMACSYFFFFFFFTSQKGWSLSQQLIGQVGSPSPRLKRINAITVTFSPLGEQHLHAVRQRSISLTHHDIPNCVKCSLINTCAVWSAEDEHAARFCEDTTVRIFFPPVILNYAHVTYVFVRLKCDIGYLRSWHVASLCTVSNTHAPGNQPFGFFFIFFYPRRHRLGAF